MIRRLGRKYVGESSKRTTFGLANPSSVGDSTSVSDDDEGTSSSRRVSLLREDLFFRSNRLHENVEGFEGRNNSPMVRHGVSVFLTVGIVILRTGREDAFDEVFMATLKTPRQTQSPESELGASRIWISDQVESDEEGCVINQDSVWMQMQMTRYTKQGRQVGVGKIQNASTLFRLHLSTTTVDQISVEAILLHCGPI